VDLAFIFTSLVVVVSPGTGVLYTLATGLSSGSRASVVAAFGCTLGILPHMAAAIMGLTALLYTSALAFEILKYLGVAYLLYKRRMTVVIAGQGKKLEIPTKDAMTQDKLLTMVNAAKTAAAAMVVMPADAAAGKVQKTGPPPPKMSK